MNFFNHKGLTYGLIGTGISVLLYKLCQNKWVSDVLKMMYNGTVNTLIAVSKGVVNTSSAIKYATIRTIDWTTGYFSQRAKDKRIEEDMTAKYAINLKNELHALIEKQKQNQGMMLRNLDYLVYHNDWNGVIQLCNDEYENASTELKECIANLYTFSHEAKLLCQNTDLYANMVDPRLISFMTDNKYNSLDEIEKRYNIDIKNITWSKPDNNLYYSVMKEHFQISDNLLETRYMDNEGFQPMYELISEDVAFKHNLTSPERYEIARDSKGVIERLKKELYDLQNKTKELEEKRIEAEKKAIEKENEVVTNNEAVTDNEVVENKEELLTYKEAVEQYNNNRDVIAIQNEQLLQPSGQFEYINNRVLQNYENPIQLGNSFNPNMRITNINPVEGSIPSITNTGAITAVIVSAILGVLGYLYNRNHNSDKSRTLPKKETYVDRPETEQVLSDESDNERVVEIETDNKKPSKSILQTISDYFWPKED